MKNLFKYLALGSLLLAPCFSQVSIDWADVDKTGSSLANLTTRSATDLTSGTLPDGRFPATLPALSGVNLTALNASNIASGTLGAARLPAFTLNFSGVLHTTPVTFTAGVATATLASQSANLVFAGPASGSAATPTFRALVQADTQGATAPTRNALAPRGGIVLNSTEASRITGTLTGQNIGVDPFSIVVTHRVPTTLPSVAYGLVYLGASSSTDGASSINLHYENSGALRVNTSNAAATGGVYCDLVNFQQTYSGKVVILGVTRSGSTLAIYVNGVSQQVTVNTYGTNPSDFSASIPSNYLGVGYTSSTYVTPTTIYSATLYNLALSAADVQEIYELGGGVPSKYRFGSQNELIAATTDRDFSGAGNWSGASGGTATVNAGKLDCTGNANVGVSLSIANFTPAMSLWPKGRAVRVRFTISNLNTGSLRAQLDSIDSTIVQNIVVGSYDQIFVIPSVQASSQNTFKVAGNTSTAYTWSLDDISLIFVGAVVHLPFTDQLGTQARDASTNGLHAERTTTGTYWTDPRQSGRQTLTYTFTHSAISSTAATTTAFILPPNTVLREIQLNRTAAFDASTTLDIGISGTPTKFVTATNVVPTGFAQVTSSSLVPESATAVTTVYVKKNQATTTGSVTMNFIIEAVGSPTQ